MAFLTSEGTEYLIEKLSDSKNIKISGNRYGNRVSDVVNNLVHKTDNITKAVEQEVVNNSDMFKVGTGNVDVSSDVHDGFGEIGLKGVTYQNLLGELEAVSTTWQQTNDKYILDLKAGNGQPQIRYRLSYPLKPNTKYTLICEIKEYTTGYPHFCFMTGDNKLLASTREFTPNTVGIHSAVLTTVPDITAELLRILPRSSIDNTYSIGKNIVILEGDHTNNPNLPLYFEGIVGVGDRSKNLLNPSKFIHRANITMNKNQIIDMNLSTSVGQCTIFDGLNLPKGTYKVTAEVLEGSYTGGNLVFYDSNNTKFTEVRLIGTYTIDASNNDINRLLLWDPKGICKIRLQLEKGYVATSYEPYYDGHKIEVLSCGKNLLYDTLDNIPSYLGKANDLNVYSVINGKHYYGSSGQDYRNTSGTPMLSCKPNTVYSISLENPCRIEVGNPFKGIKIADTNDFKTNITFTTESNQHYMSVKIWRSDYINTEEKYLIGDIQIEESPTPTSYAPYQEDKTHILIDEPLMRLPNGVCDEITRDGKLIRRVGKIVFDGSENWSNGGYTNADKQELYLSPDKIIPNGKHGGPSGYSYNNYISDKFPTIQGTIVVSNKWLALNGAGGITLALPKAELTEPYYNKAKQWLSQNPTIFYYELETPIITELPAPYLRIFKDGHLTFNTLIAPESNHVVQINKSAQIERSIREVQSLDSRVGQLESFYDDMMLETSHKLNLLTYDFEYTRERNGE